MKTVVYTKNHFVACDSTKKLLDDLGVEYETVDIVSTPGVLDQLAALNFRSAPVVVAPSGEAWSGFREEKIRAVFA